MLQSLKQLIPKAIGRSGIGQSMYAANVVTIATCFFDQLFGEQANQIRVISFRAGVLTVECLNSVMANEIIQSETKLRMYLKKKIPQMNLRSIRTRLIHEFETC